VTPQLPLVYLARHGETAWTISGQHTGLSDIPLTEHGERDARALGERIRGLQFARVLTSPLQRAAKTCTLAGFGDIAVTDADLVEWNYGEYDGRTSSEIRKTRPDWELFHDGCPGGETLDQVAARADRVVAKLRSADDTALVFSSGHFLRILAARWLGQDPQVGRLLYLNPATLSTLGYEHSKNKPVLRLWNDSGHIS
jgi:broad specificity phosphatase PhoE